MTLLPHHEDELVTGSGIDPAVITARPYRSVTAAEVLGLGFSDFQCRPGLAAQLYTVAGDPGNWIIKADDPRRDDKGKALKYEIPNGARHHLDIHPAAQPLLRDATIPLLFTEGHKKADSAWSRGLPCVAITGVYGFMRDGRVIPDFDDIALRSRTVYVVYDSDVGRNPNVAEARFRLCAALSRRGAKVMTITLPEVA